MELLALTGKAVEGEVLTAVEIIPKSETQQRVWSKYKKDVRYQWYGGTFSSSCNIFEMSLQTLTLFTNCSHLVAIIFQKPLRLV